MHACLIGISQSLLSHHFSAQPVSLSSLSCSRIPSATPSRSTAGMDETPRMMSSDLTKKQAVTHCFLLHCFVLLVALLSCPYTQAAAWGFSSLLGVPASPLDILVRPLCDRCATQIAGIAAHCPQCGWDVCVTCAAELREQAQAAAAAAAAVAAQQTAAAAEAATAAAQHPQAAARPVQQLSSPAEGLLAAVTCCNPECSAVSACEEAVEPLGNHVPQYPAAGEHQQQAGTAAACQRERDGSPVSSLDEAAAEEADYASASQASQDVPVVARRELFSVPGNPHLQLQLVLAPDLLESLAELQQLAQVRSSGWHQALSALPPRKVPPALHSSSGGVKALCWWKNPFLNEWIFAPGCFSGYMGIGCPLRAVQLMYLRVSPPHLH